MDSIPVVVSTSLLGMLFLWQQVRLRGRGAAGGAQWGFMNLMGIFGMLTLFLFSMGGSDFLEVLRGGRASAESRDIAPRDPHSKIEYNARKGSGSSPPPKFTVFYLQPYAKCRFCKHEGYMPLAFHSLEQTAVPSDTKAAPASAEATKEPADVAAAAKTADAETAAKPADVENATKAAQPPQPVAPQGASKAAAAASPSRKKPTQHKQRNLTRVYITPEEFDNSSLTFMLRLIHVPGYCLSNKTEKGEACHDTAKEWVVSNLFCDDYDHYDVRVSADDAHADTRKTEDELIQMWESEDFSNLRASLTPIWPRLTDSAPKTPPAASYKKQAIIFYFTTKLQNFEAFLKKVISLMKRIDLERTLSIVEPSDSEPLTRKEFERAFQFFKGLKPRLLCRANPEGEKKSEILKELGICFDHQFKFKRCVVRQSCNERFIFRKPQPKA